MSSKEYGGCKAQTWGSFTFELNTLSILDRTFRHCRKCQLFAHLTSSICMHLSFVGPLVHLSSSSFSKKLLQSCKTDPVHF